MKLWQKESAVPNDAAQLVETFTVGNDKTFDLLLAESDVKGSLAHATMLRSIHLLSEQEFHLVEKGLQQLLKEIRDGDFAIDPGIEDVHSQVEFLLTKRIGDAGKKIHSGRSRNDQVLLDIKLYIREELRSVAQEVKAVFDVMQGLSEKYKEVLLPGYTHFQVAMPSSFGLWFGAYAESLSDDLEMILGAFRTADKNPLGSGAGFGSSFPLDRTLTTKLLGFESMNYNVVYAQMSRGKAEKVASMSLACVAATLSKLSYDVCLYLSQNFGFISFPDQLTTGSSIMPHKKNPDVFELIRARCNKIQALPNELTLLVNNLPSGYHRDLQVTKESLFPAFQTLKECLRMTAFMLRHIQVNTRILQEEQYKYLWSVEAVNREVLNGIPFRDAYRKVGNAIAEGSFEYHSAINHTHEGSMGNLCNEEIRVRMEKTLKQFNIQA